MSPAAGPGRRGSRITSADSANGFGLLKNFDFS
jgi:hypothetical protein